MTCTGLTDPSPVDFVPATLQTFAKTYQACEFSWQCLPKFAHCPLDLIAFNGLDQLIVSTKGCLVGSFYPGDLITECFLFVVHFVSWG